MKKGIATMIWIMLLGFAVLAWGLTMSGKKQSTVAYATYLEQAKMYEEKEIYITAQENYKAALELNPGNYDITMKIADMYYLLGDMKGFVAACDEAIAINSKKEEPYLKKINYYIESQQYSEALSVTKKASQIFTESKELAALKKDLSSKYIEKYIGYADIGSWHRQSDIHLVPAQKNGRWGMITQAGSMKISPQFDYVGAYDKNAGVIPCCLAGEYYYMDTQGYKRLVGKKDYQFLGSFGNGLAPAQRDNVYGYIDVEFNEKNFEYEYAGPFANKVAAVKKDGKWALINTELKNITEFEFDEVVMDDYGFCSLYETIVVRKGTEYFFINREGQRVGNATFDNAAFPAANKAYIAVCKGELWGYADSEGNMVIEPQFEQAKSFALGFAPVCVNDMWGYINTDGEIVIDPMYVEASVFSSDGSAAVKNFSAWNIIILCEYDN